MTTPVAPFTLAQQLQTQSLTQLRVLLLSLLQAEGYPAITEWASEPTGTEMTFVDMVCQAINQLAQSGAPVDQQIASMAAGRTLRWAKGKWLDLLAEQVYKLARDAATFTTFSMTLVSSADADPYTLEPGDVWITGPTGLKYQSTSGGSLAPGSTLEIAFKAENIGSTYADDPTEVTLQLVTSLAGVTLRPGGGDFTIVTNSGGSTGLLQPQRTDPSVAPVPHTYSILIVVPGDAGAATFSVQTDSGPFEFHGLLEASNPIGDGTTIEALNGIAPSFLANDIFVFSTPGTPNYIQGDDIESDASLAARCRARWPSLSLNVLDETVILWTVTAYPGANRVAVEANEVIPGRFIVTVADSHGGVDQASLDTIQAYIKPRLGTGEDMGAESATVAGLTAIGNVQVPTTTSALRLEEIQNAVDIAWRAYLASVPIGGVVLLSRLTQILMDAGALDVGTIVVLQIFDDDGFGGAQNYALLNGQVPIERSPLSQTLTWGIG